MAVMKRYAIKISYNGKNFSGWQKQPGGRTVQGTLENVLQLLAGHPVTVCAAGRTDKGVHAVGQIVSFDLERSWDPQKLLLAVNANLPEDVSAIKAFDVEESFHARYSALWREYVYFIWTAKTCYPHFRDYVWHRKQEWDLKKVKQACRCFLGEKNYRAFCRKSECPPNASRTIYKAEIFTRGDLVWFRVRGNSFLTNMVRIMVGTLDCIGTGKQDIDYLESLFEDKAERPNAGPTAPAKGLFFWKVGYPSSLL
ncbi:tRNA pseudouridine(38-40) synthase TruA [Thermovirga sp.]|uniref:tRNA pseudouridine(38-40) synthase TruA n=1 Tax=Thermovirga sp. TaxID=2699834 RepID=UPI0025FEA831|nr:tRNA pseudouridine(38-40) synthase TruA [Thermovirga sp.]